MNAPRPLIENGKGLWGGRLLSFDSLPSTNRWALDNVGDCRHGDIVWAIEQTAGRGRFDRKWISTGGRCLTLSLILKENHAELPVTLVAALGVRSCLARFELQAMAKWPNDVMVNGMKIAGILAEREPAAGATVLGIGLNVNMERQDLDDIELLQPATSMAIEARRELDISIVRDALIAELGAALDIAGARTGSFLIDAWRKNDFLTGKRVTADTPQGRVSGSYRGLDEQGRLILTGDDGVEHRLWSADVSVSAQVS